MLIRSWFICGLLLVFAGCSGPKQTYEVVVYNDAAIPVTVWLTKTAPPADKGWAPPEVVAVQQPGEEEPIGGVVIPPGKTASTPRMSGHFPEGVDAILRVYRGELWMSEILAIGPTSPNRIDFVLTPGKNELVVNDKSGRIAVQAQASPKDGER